MSISPDVISARSYRAPVLGAGLTAGVMGGLAEVAWIALYQQAGGTQAAAVARGVTDTVMPSLAAASYAAWLGVGIHMLISVALGLAIAVSMRRALPRIAGTAFEATATVGLLMAVWAVNFFVVLPVVNPDFVTVVPLGVSFVSKTLFGVAAAVMLMRTGKSGR